MPRPNARVYPCRSNRVNLKPTLTCINHIPHLCHPQPSTMLRPLARNSLLSRVQRRTFIRHTFRDGFGIQGGRQPAWVALGRGTVQQPSSPKTLEIYRRLKEQHERPSAIIRDLYFDADLPPDVLPLLLGELDARLRAIPRSERRKAMLEQPMAAQLLRGMWRHESIWRGVTKVFSAQDMLCT